MIVLHFSIQGQDINECANGKCNVLTFQYARGKYSRALLLPSVILCTLRQLVDYCVT